MPTKLRLPSTDNRSKGTILRSISGRKALEMYVQSLAPKRVFLLEEIRLPDVKRGKSADMKFNVLSAGLNSDLVPPEKPVVDSNVILRSLRNLSEQDIYDLIQKSAKK